MSAVLLYERAIPSFAAGLAKRGHHIVYRANETNHCPGCGRSHWLIGRSTAECGFCGTAVPLAEQRLFPRMSAKGRKLKLLIDGSPTSFALHNISEGGVMGAGVPDLSEGA